MSIEESVFERASPQIPSQNATAALNDVESAVEDAAAPLSELLGNLNLDEVIATADELAQQTTSLIRRNPWPAVGIAAGIGVLAGLLSAKALKR